MNGLSRRSFRNRPLRRIVVVGILAAILTAASMLLVAQQLAPASNAQTAALAQYVPYEVRAAQQAALAKAKSALAQYVPYEVRAAQQVAVSKVTVAATASDALAAELPAAAGNTESLPLSYVAQCEAQLVQATPNRQQAMAPYAGLASLRSVTGRYDLWRPADWSVSGVDPAAIVLTPEGYSRVTHFSIQVTDTPEATTIEDLLGRIEWFNNLANTLPGSQVEWQARWRSGNVSGFDARYTYQDYNNDATNERWVRVLFVGTKRYFLVAEAPAVTDFNSLEPMFLAMMVTFRPDNPVEQATVDMCIA